MARYHRSSRRHRSFTRRRTSKPARKPSRRYSAYSGKFKRAPSGKKYAPKSSSGGGFKFKTSTMLIGGVAIGGLVLWMAQKRAAAAALAVQSQMAAAARVGGSGPFPTSTSAMAPAPLPSTSNYFAPLFDLLKPSKPSVVPG